MKPRASLYRVTVLWAALLLAPAPSAWAAAGDLDSTAAAVDRGVTTREERAALFTRFGVPTTGNYAGLPPGQALVLFSLCGTNTDCQKQALADRKAHMGWGKVVEDLKAKGFTTANKLGEAVRRVTDVHRDLVAKADKAKAEKTDAAERTHIDRPTHPERPGR